MSRVDREARLDAAARDAALRAMTEEPLDILVIGGGITGAGVALDAATRGLRTGVVEAQDWAAGTSSRSSKLVHGGLRYLQMLDFKLVHEALGERGLLLDRLAPHLVRAVPFLYPLEKWWERPYVAAGIGLYDVLATVGTDNRAVPTHRHLTAKGVRRVFPDIKADACAGAVRYYDGQVDDARLVIALVRTAMQYGAHAASRTEVVELLREGERVVGATIRDLETGTDHTVRATVVIAAAGVWTEQVQDLAVPDGGLQVLASKGIHIVVERERINSESGFILQTPKSVLFIIPWSRYWVIGTTDTEYHGDLATPPVTSADIDYVLEQANQIMARPLTRDDVIGTWAGLRPLLQPGTKGEDAPTTTKVSREHTVTEVAPGLVSIAGGKLTTYRVMGEDAVDFALGKFRSAKVPSETATTPLVGAAGYRAYARQARRISADYGWDDKRVAHLLHRYGAELPTLLAMVDERPEWGHPVPGAEAYLGVEIAFGITHEGALHLEDLMTTRTRLTYEVRRQGRDAVPVIAEIAAELLGWDDQRRRLEVESYEQRCAAEDAAAAAPDDAAAAEVRGRDGEVLHNLPDGADASIG